MLIKKNRVFTGTICVGLAMTMLATTAFAAPVEDITVAGVAAAMQEETKQETPTLVAPLAAAAVLADAALGNQELMPLETEAEMAAMDPTDALMAEHPAVLAAEARMEEEKNSPYKNIAISQVESYVNIRDKANAESEILGKIYNNAAATILETVTMEDGDWYKIKSGSVEGYIKAEYFVTGDEAEAKAIEIGNVYATINTETLRLREEADLASRTLSLLSAGESYTVEEQGAEFTKLSIDGDLVGYVHNDYITIDVDFEEAISIEEELAEQERLARLEQERLAAEAELRRQQEEEQKRQTTTAKKETTKSETKKETTKAETKKETTKAETKKETTKAETKKETTKAETTKEETKKETTKEETKKESTEKENDKSSGSNSSLRSAIVSYALSFVGNLEYVYGGNSLETGTDCSGFVQLIYKKYGVYLPRTSDNQGYCGESISYDEIQPGDLVYYGGHIAIYIGDGQVVHASSERDDIKISRWNYRTPKGIRNVID